MKSLRWLALVAVASVILFPVSVGALASGSPLAITDLRVVLESEGINDAGQIVGQSVFFGPSKVGLHAALWDKGQMIDLGVLPGGDASDAKAINVSGQVVGNSNAAAGEESIGTGTHAVLWVGGG
jgi:probable HAF family extracellular repeat protein